MQSRLTHPCHPPLESFCKYPLTAVYLTSHTGVTPKETRTMRFDPRPYQPVDQAVARDRHIPRAERTPDPDYRELKGTLVFRDVTFLIRNDDPFPSPVDEAGDIRIRNVHDWAVDWVTNPDAVGDYTIEYEVTV